MKPFQRAIVGELEQALRRDRRLLQVVVGPRQVGKTTAVHQLLERLKWPSHVAAADVALPPGPEWIESHWSAAAELHGKRNAPTILVLDEIQKVRGWSDVVKRLWDDAVQARRPMRVILLGSSSLLLQRGLMESLAGRFLFHRCPHWSWTAFLVSGVELYSSGRARHRSSSPKLILWNSALIHALSPLSFAEARRDGAWWGRVVENAVGAHLLNSLFAPAWHVTYWREGSQEVDFVVARGRETWALEVKSGRPGRLSGLATFRARYPRSHALLIGGDGIPLDHFFARSPADFLSS